MPWQNPEILCKSLLRYNFKYDHWYNYQQIMRAFIPAIALMFLCLSLQAQTNYTNLVISMGPSCFFNLPGAKIDWSGSVGVNYVFNKKNRVIVFNPGLNTQINAYQTKMNYNRLIHINQHLLNLTLDVLMRVGKKNRLRAGLFFNKEFLTVIQVSQRAYGGRAYSYSGSELEQDYSPTTIQAGFTLGFNMPFKLFKRQHVFSIKTMHIVSPLVDHDYNLTQKQVNEDLTALSAKARPTMLIFAFEFNLHKAKKVKNETEEE